MATSRTQQHKLIGKDFVVPDVEAKVTGRAKYVEDFRADGMVFCKTRPAPIHTPSPWETSMVTASPTWR